MLTSFPSYRSFPSSEHYIGVYIITIPPSLIYIVNRIFSPINLSRPTTPRVLSHSFAHTPTLLHKPTVQTQPRFTHSVNRSCSTKRRLHSKCIRAYHSARRKVSRFDVGAEFRPIVGSCATIHQRRRQMALYPEYEDSMIQINQSR